MNSLEGTRVVHLAMHHEGRVSLRACHFYLKSNTSLRQYLSFIT